MNVVYRVERWAEYAKDAEALWPRHYEELALNREEIALCPDIERYEKADAEGQSLIITVRDDGRLVGYFIAAIVPHLHYKNAGKMAFTDIYFLLPEYRKAGIGAKLILALEMACRAIGVTKIYLTTKIHLDNGRLFELLGYNPTDRVFTKLLT